MKKLFLGLSLLFLAAYGCVCVINILSASRNLRLAARGSRQLMEQTGAFIAEKADGPPPHSLLNSVSHLTGMERITVTDPYKGVLASSSGLFEPGDDFLDYLVDPALFDSAVASQTPVTTPLKKISGLYFRSCYYPVSSPEDTVVVVIDADRTFYSSVTGIRNNLVLTAVIQFALFFAVFVLTLVFFNRYNAALGRMKRQEKLAFLGRTASELAHEIKNPLAIIKASADVLKKKFDPKGEEQGFAFLSSETMRLSRLIDSMLNFAKDRPLNLAWVPLGETVKEIGQGFTDKWPECTLDLNAITPGIRLLADLDSFKQVVWNLLKNAVEAVQGTGRVDVAAEIQGTGLALVFHDSGPGVPDGMRTKMFDPFVSDKKEGTGLGLAVVSAACEKHGWKITAPPSGSGAKIQITIPEKLWQKSS